MLGDSPNTKVKAEKGLRHYVDAKGTLWEAEEGKDAVRASLKEMNLLTVYKTTGGRGEVSSEAVTKVRRRMSPPSKGGSGFKCGTDELESVTFLS